MTQPNEKRTVPVNGSGLTRTEQFKYLLADGEMSYETAFHITTAWMEFVVIDTSINF